MRNTYFLSLSAAFVRGRSIRDGEPELPAALRNAELMELSHSQLEQLHVLGVGSGLSLHKFKRTMGLRRVERVFGVLRNLWPENLLDIGTGRGVFLWPLLDAFPHLKVTAIDSNPQRASDLHCVALGGVRNLEVLEMDVTDLKFEEREFDIVTMLEVLEHIPSTNAAITEVCRVAKRFVVLTVPSKEDNNPEHVHLFDEDMLRRVFRDAGIRKVNFDYVPGHIVAVANVSQS